MFGDRLQPIADSVVEKNFLSNVTAAGQPGRPLPNFNGSERFLPRFLILRKLSHVVAAPVWLTTDGLLAEFGKRRAGARRKYQLFIEEGMGAESIWKDLRGQIYLGDDHFVDQM